MYSGTDCCKFRFTYDIHIKSWTSNCLNETCQCFRVLVTLQGYLCLLSLLTIFTYYLCLLSLLTIFAYYIYLLLYVCLRTKKIYIWSRHWMCSYCRLKVKLKSLLSSSEKTNYKCKRKIIGRTSFSLSIYRQVIKIFQNYEPSRDT